MRLRSGDLFRVRRATVSFSREWGAGGEGEASQLQQQWVPPEHHSCHPVSASHSFFLPWAVVSEYRASLQRRMNPKQEESAFESPSPPDAGGKGTLPDCTPAPTPTEVSAPSPGQSLRWRAGSWPWPSC